MEMTTNGGLLPMTKFPLGMMNNVLKLGSDNIHNLMSILKITEFTLQNGEFYSMWNISQYFSLENFFNYGKHIGLNI